MTSPPGRRERKKAATRQALADAALALFLDRGFDAVTVAEIAEAADVSVTTLFKHFPSKESLVFDEDAANESELVGAVRDRAPGTTVLDALHACVAARIDSLQAFHVEGAEPSGRRDAVVSRMQRFRELVDATPSVREYARRMWIRHEHALAAAIAEDLGQAGPSPQVRAVAHVVADLPTQLRSAEVPAREQLDAVFALLRDGWRD